MVCSSGCFCQSSSPGWFVGCVVSHTHYVGVLKITSCLLAFNRQLGWSVFTKRIKKLASKKIKFSLLGRHLEWLAVISVYLYSAWEILWQFKLKAGFGVCTFFLYIYWFFLKNCGVEHGFDALMESGELSNTPQVWIKEKKIASSTLMLKKNKTKISPLWCLIYNMLSVWDLCVAFVELAETSQLRKIAQGWTILWVTFKEKIKKNKK